MKDQDLVFFKKANEAFKKGDYLLALDFYKKINFNNQLMNIILKNNIKLVNFKIKTDGENKDNRFLEKDNDFKLKKKSYLSFEEAFDRDYYLYNYSDVRQAGMDPEYHYKNWGWKEFRKPNQWFNPEYYLNEYKEVRHSGIDPLEHFLKEGMHKKYRTEQPFLNKLSNFEIDSIPKIKFDQVHEGYADYKNNNVSDQAIKAIAFYLPQFHPFPENDMWWGKGFTEWTNVTKAKPNFENHYQPHLPIHNGFYDLRVPEVMMEQVRLAKNYGIYGFNFYYYWFDGKVLMHKPFEILLKNKEIDIPFCITWANENWTRRWDGNESDILISQNHCEEDSIKFIENLYDFFDDERYIRINNKPLLIIYRANIIPQMKETVTLWREKVRRDGYDGLYLVCAQTFGLKSPEEFGFDAAMEFPPHTVKSNEISEKEKIVNYNYKGKIFDYEQVVKNEIKKKEPDFKVFRTCMLSWDNTARKQNNSNIFANFSLLRYKQWVSHISNSVFNNKKYSEDEKIIFINAWNEWAEGTHLEPDREYGYSYLQATYDVLKNYRSNFSSALGRPFIKRKEYALILHIHYIDIWDDIKKYIKNLENLGFDLYVTVTESAEGIVKQIIKEYPSAVIRLVENRGRDILPFIMVYNEIKDKEYKAICKLHTKKSLYRDDGEKIRNDLYEGLLGSEDVIRNVLSNLEEENFFCPDKYLIKHTDHNMTYDHKIVDELCDFLDINFEYDVFPAGSMYWFKPNALKGLDKLSPDFFELEEGLADGTLAHAIERIIHILFKHNSR